MVEKRIEGRASQGGTDGERDRPIYRAWVVRAVVMLVTKKEYKEVS